MKRLILLFTVILLLCGVTQAESPYSVRGLCISAPSPDEVREFTDFIESALAPAGVNVLVLRVDYGYKFKLHPELVGENPLTKQDVKKLVKVCQDNHIRIIPQINLLGHQSWHGKVGKLLEVYPEFDETPEIKLPEKYEWPNADGLYCKSYCPLHPTVHDVVFDLIDEITDVFETNAFHAGMDEVFYIGHEQCPRCYGKDKAELFAGEVTRIRNHLNQSGKELWIWGDRLIDGKTTGLGIWEASYNNTHRAIDLIPKDVVICDWHYENAAPTAAMFAMKGLQVITCPWRNPDVAVKQENMMRSFYNDATKATKPNYLGMMQTVWGSLQNFMESYKAATAKETSDKSADSFNALVKAWK